MASSSNQDFVPSSALTYRGKTGRRVCTKEHKNKCQHSHFNNAPLSTHKQSSTGQRHRNGAQCTHESTHHLTPRAEISSSPLEQLMISFKPRLAWNPKHKPRTTYVQNIILKCFDFTAMKGNFFLLRNKLKAIDLRGNVSNNRLEFQRKEIY